MVGATDIIGLRAVCEYDESSEGLHTLGNEFNVSGQLNSPHLESEGGKSKKLTTSDYRLLCIPVLSLASAIWEPSPVWFMFVPSTWCRKQINVKKKMLQLFTFMKYKQKKLKLF